MEQDPEGCTGPFDCKVNADGTRELVSIHAENVGDTQWTRAGPHDDHGSWGRRLDVILRATRSRVPDDLGDVPEPMP